MGERPCTVDQPDSNTQSMVLSHPTGWKSPQPVSFQPTQHQTPWYNIHPASWGIFPTSAGKLYEDQQAIKPVHLPGTNPCLIRGKKRSMAQTPDSAAHLLFHFFCNLVSTGSSIIATTTIDSRFWFRLLSFIVSLLSLLLWFPLFPD